MRFLNQPPLHLSYDLGIHPGESWDALEQTLREKAVAVRRQVEDEGPFGLGLRIGGEAAAVAADPGKVEGLKALMAEHGFYAFTIDGFSHGPLHGRPVKEKVYQPDWRTPLRRRYSLQLADLLAGLLPEDLDGSINTVPCSYRPWILRPGDAERMVANLVEAARHLAVLREQRGRCIHLGLEPEPGCYLENTEDVVTFFNDHLLRKGGALLARRYGYGKDAAEGLLRDHVGVCFDTCHLAMQYEDLAGSIDRYRAEGIRISKVQLGAALDVINDRPQLEALRPYVEPVYLHQVTARNIRGGLRSWSDLPEALRDVRQAREFEALRILYHLPLAWPGSDLLRTTSPDLDPPFFTALKSGVCSHLEIEISPPAILPPTLREIPLEETIAREYAWVRERMGSPAAPQGRC